LLVLIAAACFPSFSQSSAGLQAFFRDNIGLSQDQIAMIRNGQPVAKTLESRTPDEVFIFGATSIQAAPESYVKFSTDFDRLRKLPGYLAIGEFSNPPKLSDLTGFTFEREDIEALKNCKPGNCQIQMPGSSMEELRRSVDFSSPDAANKVNQLLQKAVLERLIEYQHEGNPVLGVYNDKRNPTEVSEQFKYLLSYSKAFPKYLPDFYNYLLTYPSGKPANVQDTFYWTKVKFGLKPTLRVVHLVVMRGEPTEEIANVVAEKQLYSSHYFETALDLSFCARENVASRQGFYLITVMGSEQAGLTGPKGAIIRRVAVGRSVSSLESALATIKSSLEVGR
jgi:hypothetical protein